MGNRRNSSQPLNTEQNAVSCTLERLLACEGFMGTGGGSTKLQSSISYRKSFALKIQFMIQG
jgi:hypothetical protein